MKPNGYVLYRGPSMIDGKPIVAIVTGTAGASANVKTGDMLQTWIMRADVGPVDALKTGDDASVCGDCKHRPANGGACYVQVFQGPRSVWAAWQRGRYPDAVDVRAIGRGRNVRLGSYGDPAAVPAHVWRELIADAAMHTGYTHQWGSGCADALRGIVMASADSEVERDEARAQGWRTFRVRLASDALGERESVCPASEEAGRKLSCASCGMCNGADSGRKGSIAIVVHGALAKRYERQRSAIAMR